MTHRLLIKVAFFFLLVSCGGDNNDSNNEGPPFFNGVPLIQSVNEDSLLLFNTGNNNLVSLNLAEIDFSSVTLSVNNGVIEITLASGASISQGANNSASMTISGTEEALNSSLSVINYKPNFNYNGTDVLSLLALDQQSQTKSISIPITVLPVNDLTQVDDELVISAKAKIVTGDVSINDRTISLGNLTFSKQTDPTSGTIVFNTNGSYSYTRVNNAFDGSDSFTYLVTDSASGESSTGTVNLSISSLTDSPVNQVPSLVATDRNAVFSFTGSESLIVSDVDTSAPGHLVSVQLSVTNGTISVIATGSGGFASISSGSSGSASFTLSGSEAEIQASLATVTFSPNFNFVGTAVLKTLSSDGDSNTSEDVSFIRVTSTTASTPSLSNLEGDLPSSSGLSKETYNSQTILLAGASDGSNDSSIIIDAALLEGLSESASADEVTQDADRVGLGIIKDISTFDSSNTEVLQGENSLLVYSGLIYLESGTEYGIDAYIDDALHVELGGKVITSTNITASQFGTLDSLSLSDSSESSFTPTANGFYTIEAYHANLDDNGAFSLNLVSAPGPSEVPRELNAYQNQIFSTVDDLILSGGQIGSFISNAINEKPDGGYFSISTGVDIVGVEGAPIYLSILPLAVSASDVVSSITIDSLPAGVVISDRTSFIFNNNAGEANEGESSFTFTPKSSLNPSGLNLSQLNIVGLASTTTLTINATTSNLSGTNTSTSLTGAPFTIGVLPSSYLGSGSSSLESLIQGTGPISLSSGVNDHLICNGALSVLNGMNGNDVLEGDEQANTLIGGEGFDLIRGGEGDDFIIGGTQADVMYGGLGVDTFVWISGDHVGAPTDIVIDFAQGVSGDVLDLSGLLVGENSGNISSFISLSGSTLTIDIDGAIGGTAFDDLTIELSDLTSTTLTQLISDGNIKTD